MAIPSRPQTFGMENCHDVIEKLGWEIDQLRKASPHDAASQIHICYNAAITAWQIADWVFLDFTNEQKTELGFDNLTSLQNHVREQCRALHLCRQIATASKHGIVDRFSDKAVDARTSATDLPIDADDTFIFATPPIWEMAVIDGEKRLRALEVFENAYHF